MKMTKRELIDMFKNQIFPSQVRTLKNVNYEGKGETDAQEYLRDTTILLDLAEKGLAYDTRHKAEKESKFMRTIDADKLKDIVEYAILANVPADAENTIEEKWNDWIQTVIDRQPTVEAIPKDNVYKAIQEMMKYEHEGFINISLARLDEILKKCEVVEDGSN